MKRKPRRAESKPRAKLKDRIDRAYQDGYAVGVQHASSKAEADVRVRTSKENSDVLAQDLKIMESMEKLGRVMGQTIEAMARSLGRGRGL